MLAERCGQVLITKFDPMIFQSVVFHAFLRTTVDDVSICTFTQVQYRYMYFYKRALPPLP